MRFGSTTLGTIIALATLLAAPSAFAQAAGECSSGFCGTPNDNGGGGCGCGCGCSVLVNFTDMGVTYSTSDDFDNDGFEDDFDNCPFTENRDQLDSDGDGIGDSCDNAPHIANPDQSDIDGDGIGDVADPDLDGDGIANGSDNCPRVYNPTQKATLAINTGTLGDACNPDDDGDGILDTEDPCPKVAGRVSLNGKACDDDEDLDGILDSADNCPGVANPDQKDMNHNGIGDACDLDIDGDGIANNLDNAPNDPNPDQLDGDRDGIGDVADPEFCYVYNRAAYLADKTECLNPNDTFKVAAMYLTQNKILPAGEDVRLIMLANRKDTPMTYTWNVTARPAGSSAVVKNSEGKVVTSNGTFEYRYQIDSLPSFKPDIAGHYELQLVGTLAFPDEQFQGGPTIATKTLALEVAEGKAGGGGCATTHGDVSLGALFLAGLTVLALRRKRT